MKEIMMVATVPNSPAGTLRSGKPYLLDDGLADRLVEGGYAREVAPHGEAAVVRPTEHAARRTGGVPKWPLKMPPAQYLKLHGDGAPNSELAKQVLAARDQEPEGNDDA